MRCPPALPNEAQRLAALAEYGLTSDQPLPSLEPVVQIAAHAFDVSAAAVNMIGREEVFFAASTGISECDMRRDVSFCAHAITQDDVLVVEDALLDSRFHDNPLVTGSARIRFYAGVPVRSLEGHALGALCVVDSDSRPSFSRDDRARLKELAKLVSDRLELRRLQVAGENSPKRFEQIALASPNAIFCLNQSQRITSANPAAEAIFGRISSEMVGEPLQLILPAWKASKLGQSLKNPPDGAAHEQMIEELIGRRFDGTEIPVEVAWSSWQEGEHTHSGLVMRDLSSERRQEDELFRFANFDQVTSLPNLNLFQERLRELTGGDQAAAVLSIGLAGHQHVSDTMGTQSWGQVLEQLSRRLQHGVRNTDVVARLASDEFGICLRGIGDPLRAREAASTALAALSQPVLVDDFEVRLDGHCGIALCPSHGTEVDQLIGNANLALQEARKQSAGHICLFTPALRMAAVARRMFDSDLHRAVEREELQLYYQPQVRLVDGALTGAEALLRWNHPERGVLLPGAFLPALEASSLAANLGSWIIDTACRQAAEWRKGITPDFRISINLFAAQFRCGGLRSIVNEAMGRYQLPGHAIELEITETTVLDEEALYRPLLEGLSEDGVQLAFDDFGTGFASLSMLARYPLNHVKIDKSFIQKAFSSDRDRAIVEAITALAHQLNLGVIAEGVESRRYLEFCRDVGCDEAQGFLLGAPVPATRFAAQPQRERLCG